jgi:hypothetical protein
MGHRQRGRNVAVRDRRESSREREAQRERARQVREALIDEVRRFDLALGQAKHPVILETAFGPYEVDYVTYNLDAGCHPAGKPRDSYNCRTFMLANDARWHTLMAAVGEARHPLFAEPPMTPQGVAAAIMAIGQRIVEE